MNVLLVSKSFMVIKALSSIFNEIDREIIVSGVNSREGYFNHKLKQVDLIFFDINNDIFEEKEIVNIIKNKGNIKIIILDMNKDKNIFIKYVANGADGYIVSIDDKEEFLFRIKRIMGGKRYYDLNLTKLIANMNDANLINTLTAREREVLQLVCKGLNNEEIGAKLHISRHTVKKYVSNIFNKFNLKNKRELIIYIRDNY